MESNLDCFLHCTTPVVQSQFLPKTEIRNLNRLWHPWEREKVEYFTLGDLWKCFDEWSAYGAKVPITLNNGETLTQYYVPYLSAIQIFTGFRVETESGDGDTRDFYSDCCSEESDSDKLWRWDGTGSTSSEDGGSEQEALLHLNDRLGYLYFQFFEKSTPYGRVPLLDKINGLARRFPGLMTLRSVDLSPASWMAVSWYPIYHIPMGRTIKDLSTCFLTYHTLSSSFQDMEMEEEEKGGGMKRRQRREVGEGISVTAFGVVTYKMQGSLWVAGNGGRDQERLVSLSSVAESWLKQLRVQHHDFNYFTGLRRG
ncbi:uncharacterized protein LOC120077111 [Benincasa hispida]|uniref:uncharacterized protein LOC120077111 n=1 Tax=Benincasa hispida TaxID=102211 RepID=UPI001900A340|nr:uncharacterized protein LOC120077111 [Benincasa hispida]